MRRAARSYGLVAMALHWVMALGVLVLIAMGLIMVHANLGPARLFQLYQLHKSIGITVLLTAVLRLAWRLTHRPPDLPEEMPRMETAAAAGSHGLLYFLLFAQPISGWAVVSASALGIPTVLFGVIPWPHLPYLATVSSNSTVENTLEQVHAYGAYLLIAIIGIHVAAALWHHLIVRDDVLLRMLPRHGELRSARSLQEETTW